LVSEKSTARLSVKNTIVIRAKAPLRISFAGGGTDVSPYCDEKGGMVISATINRYAYATVQPSDNNEVSIVSLDAGNNMSFPVDAIPSYNGTLDLTKATIRLMGVSRGCSLLTHSDAIPGSGLGSSSALVVALVGVFRHWLNRAMTDYEIAETAYRIEREEVGLAGGRQDQYAATFGGFNLMEFTKDYTLVSPLRIKEDVINELEYRLLLCHTGMNRLSSGIISDQVTAYKSDKTETIHALDRTKELAVEMKRAILTGQVDEVGHLLDTAWQHKKHFTAKISNSAVDKLYEAGKEHGAIGGKLLGAGGGGCMLFLCESGKKHLVAEALEREGGAIIPFGFDHRGVCSWELREPHWGFNGFPQVNGR
jgi:D-glycero-alpha-D-manno-heptose-7-phosphate kinase